MINDDRVWKFITAERTILGACDLRGVIWRLFFFAVHTCQFLAVKYARNFQLFLFVVKWAIPRAAVGKGMCSTYVNETNVEITSSMGFSRVYVSHRWRLYVLELGDMSLNLPYLEASFFLISLPNETIERDVMR